MTRKDGSIRTSALCVGVCLASLFACGGTEESPRGSGPTTPVLPEEDRGGRPADCTAEGDLELMWVEDFETGAATGWYANTDVCKACNDLNGERSDLNRPLNCLFGGLQSILRNDEPDIYLRAQEAAVRPVTGGGCTVEQVLEEYGGHDDLDELDDDEIIDLAAEMFVELLDRAERIVEGYQDCGLQECYESQSPYIFDKPLRASEVIGGHRCESQYAMHLVAPQLRDWGGNFGRNFSVSEPLDLRDWEGIAFWGRVGPGSRSMLKVSIADAFTDEKFVVDGEPVCLFDTPEDNTTDGCDKHGSWVSLSENWELYKLPFSEMRQAGWGKPAPFFDVSRVLGLSFDYQAGSWDIWIDDVGFYRSAD